MMKMENRKYDTCVKFENCCLDIQLLTYSIVAVHVIPYWTSGVLPKTLHWSHPQRQLEVLLQPLPQVPQISPQMIVLQTLKN